MLFDLKYQGVFEIPEGNGACVITLTDENETRALSIVTTRELAMNLKEHEKKLDSVKTNALDILYSQASLQEGFSLCAIVLDAEKDKGFKAYLHFARSQGTEEFQVEVDQAVLLSLVSGVQIKATTMAFQYFSTPFNKSVQSVALPIIGLPEPMLRKALDQAIGDENYEMASVIRDEIKRREEENKILDNE